jgi:hypothetical protein
MYVGRRRSGRRRTVPGILVGVLVILNGPAFALLQHQLAAKPSPPLALISFAGVVAIAVGLWILSKWGERRMARKHLETLGLGDAF